MNTKRIPLLLSHSAELIGMWQASPQGAHTVRQIYFSTRKYLGSRDRRLISDIYYDVIRNLRLYAYQYSQSVTEESDPPAAFLAVNAYKSNFMQDGPDVQFKISDEISTWYKKLPFTIAQPQNPALRWSVPDFVYDSLTTHFGQETAEYCLKSYHKKTGVHIRNNNLRNSPEYLEKILADYKPHPGKLLPGAFRFDNRNDLINTSAFKMGRFEFQDESSQLAAVVCNPSAENTIYDVCAGAGGKSLHLASLMNGRGKIVASDVSYEKLRECQRRQRAAGARNIYISSPEKLARGHDKSADIVLIDSPCSGSGSYARHPHTKWDINEKGLMDILAAQSDILDLYSKLVKPGGYLVYATCSVCAEENWMQVDAFLERHPDFQRMSALDELKKAGVRLVDTYHDNDVVVLPFEYNSIGFYIAKLKKNK